MNKTTNPKKYLKKVAQNPYDYTYFEKCKSYNEAGFKITPRENKFTGFELVRKHYDNICKTEFGIGFDQLFRKPLEEAFPFPDEYYQVIPNEYFASK
jgi:hypothetical protein